MPQGELISALRLALIGRDIAHSRSPELYRRLLGADISYELLNYLDEAALPSADWLASHYDGINITTPWKSHYAEYAVGEAVQWGAVNCLRFRAGLPEATNTDALALAELLPTMQKRYRPTSWVVLGDGVMARVLSRLMQQQQIPFTSYARRQGHDLARLNLSASAAKAGPVLLINACAREFNFTGTLNQNCIFWDLNYAHAFHQKHLPERCMAYVDGLALLETQAQHAVKFWESHG